MAGLRASTSTRALSISRSSRSSAFTPSPLRPDTSTNGLPLVLPGVAQFPRRAVRQRHHLVREVRRALGFVAMAERGQRLLQQLLQIALPRVDHVVDGMGAAERRPVGPIAAGRRRRRPQRVAGEAGAEGPVVEVLPEQSELPELIGDVLADVGDGAVRSRRSLFRADRVALLLAGLRRKRLQRGCVRVRFAERGRRSDPPRSASPSSPPACPRSAGTSSRSRCSRSKAVAQNFRRRMSPSHVRRS